MMTHTFDPNCAEDILDSFDLTTDEEGFIVTKSESSERVRATDDDHIRADDLAGFFKVDGEYQLVRDSFVSLKNIHRRMKRN